MELSQQQTISEVITSEVIEEKINVNIPKDHMAEINYDKCMARIWNNGLGAQCSRNPIEESDFCKLHLKRNEICCEAAENKKGLWFGRIDQERPYKNKDGKLVIKWKSLQDVLGKSCKKNKGDSPAMKRLKKINKQKKPKNARSAYIFYQKDQFQILKQSEPTLKLGDISKKIGAQWKSLSESDKKPYLDLASEDKIRAQKERAEYKKDLKPKRGLSAYMFYMKEKRAYYKEKKPNMNFSELTKYIVKRWNSLKTKGKIQKYIDLSNKDKERFQKEMLEYQNKQNSLMEKIKQEIEEENKTKKSKKQQNKQCQIIDSDSDDEDNHEDIQENNNNEDIDEEDSAEEDSDEEEETINLETFTCKQPGEYDGIDLLIEKKTNKIYEGDENGISEIGQMVDGIITFNSEDDNNESDDE